MAEAIFRKNWQNLTIFSAITTQSKFQCPSTQDYSTEYRLQGLLGTRKPVNSFPVIVPLIPTMNYAPAAVE